MLFYGPLKYPIAHNQLIQRAEVQWVRMICTQEDPLDLFHLTEGQVDMELVDHQTLLVLQVAVRLMQELMEATEAAVEDMVALPPPVDMGK